MFGRGSHASQGRFGKGPYIVGGAILAIVAVLAVGAIVVASSAATLTPDSNGIAKVGMPLGGGKIESVTVIGGRSDQPVPVVVRNDPVITPKRPLPADYPLVIQVVVKRPGWIGWLAGSTERLTLHLTTPAASLRSHYVTVRGTHSPRRPALPDTDQDVLIRAEPPPPHPPRPEHPERDDHAPAHRGRRERVRVGRPTGVGVRPGRGGQLVPRRRRRHRGRLPGAGLEDQADGTPTR